MGALYTIVYLWDLLVFYYKNDPYVYHPDLITISTFVRFHYILTMSVFNVPSAVTFSDILFQLPD